MSNIKCQSQSTSLFDNYKLFMKWFGPLKWANSSDECNHIKMLMIQIEIQLNSTVLFE